MTIDLRTPGLQFLVTPGDSAAPRPLTARTTSAFAREFGMMVAVNGDFFYPWWSRTLWDYYPHVGDTVEVEGLAAARGVIYSAHRPEDAGKLKYPVLYLGRDNRASINQATGPVWNAVSGHSVLLEGGRSRVEQGETLHSRTAVGLDRPHRTLFLLVVDGRQPNYSEGCTLAELAALLKEVGAYDGLNLDGGSTTLVTEIDGRLQVLNCPIDLHVPGRERPVANHLGLRVSTRP